MSDTITKATGIFNIIINNNHLAINIADNFLKIYSLAQVSDSFG